MLLLEEAVSDAVLRLEFAGLLGMPPLTGLDILPSILSHILMHASRFLRLRVYGFCGLASSFADEIDEIASARLVKDLDLLQ